MTSFKVILRGRYNSQFVCVGGAPDETDDTLGLPFVGIKGKLFDQMLIDAGFDLHEVCFTNTVMCTPYENKLRAAVRQPSKEEIKNCGTHLLNLINLSPRKGVIAVGKVAASVLSKLKIEHHEVAHPTAILGQSEAQATVWMKRTILQLKKILNGGK